MDTLSGNRLDIIIYKYACSFPPPCTPHAIARYNVVARVGGNDRQHKRHEPHYTFSWVLPTDWNVAYPTVSQRSSPKPNSDPHQWSPIITNFLSYRIQTKHTKQMVVVSVTWMCTAAESAALRAKVNRRATSFQNAWHLLHPANFNEWDHATHQPLLLTISQ